MSHKSISKIVFKCPEEVMSALDDDQCLPLSHILKAFNAALNEEQCWALCHQTIVCFLHFFDYHSCLISDPNYLFLTKDGNIHRKSLTKDHETRVKANNKTKLLSSFGILLFRSLDYGLHEDEERSLTPSLELLIESLTSESDDEGIDCDHSFDDVIQKCVSRLSSGQFAESHYRAVCRALVAETLELSSFLDQISREEEKEEKFKDWARLWVQVIRQLRNGVKLRKVDSNCTENSVEYELTPFEMLLDDIRLKRYKLNKVQHLEHQNKKLDAHELILDFIRSRPPLIPVSQRQLRPLADQTSVYEKLMESIRQKNIKLKPIPKKVKEIEEKATTTATTPLTPRRRLIKADLRLSFDDEEQPSSSSQDNRKFSIKNLSLKLLERRHSIDICESPQDPEEDKRHHVANIWQSTDWGHTLNCLSLTLQEVQHIRSVLTKAELETLAVTQELRHDLESGRICFTCLKTRFSFFGNRPNTCKVCERAICDRCATRMHIPCETFEKVPIYMLSPSPSPPEDKHKDFIDSTRKRSALMRLVSRESESGPMVRVCRDCKILVRHLIDMGSVGNSY